MGACVCGSAGSDGGCVLLQKAKVILNTIETSDLLPNHALQRTGTAALRTAVNRPLSLFSLDTHEEATRAR
jgi:hypothetical protein